ncbi:glycosyltransferase [Rhodonellum sp.]|uniref:glycosyltransferase n=1 Tax=Rhodonellum sp. TaxID=2231180 RepID=UPI0027253EF2|nr:glycosyltransferase [Rhodonellum sp.]MDO9554494.1 glycosyltransferase [Rhodonellum sp.]
MKIIQIIFTLNQGGAERFVLDLSNELAQKHDVHLFIVRNEEEKNDFFKNELDDKVKYRSLGFQYGFKPFDYLKIYKLIKEENPDVVHCHMNTILLVLLPSIFLKEIKFFHTVHNDAKKEAKNLLFSGLRKFFYQKSLIHPITISQESKDSFLRFYGFDNSTLIYNGRKFPEKTGNFLKVKSEIESLKEAPTDLVFLHVARFNEQKNQFMLIRVFNQLIRENNGIILLIVGMGFDFEEAEELVATAGKGIYFLGEKTNVADYYHSADAFCLSSHFEGMPISIIEAFACGCVPICTPVGGITNVVKNGTTGFLSKDTSEASYYLSVKEFLKNPDSIDRNGLKVYFEKNFSIKKCAELYEKTFQKGMKKTTKLLESV